jgi:4-hydroxybenzoate polyprenyltransferase
MKYLHLIRYQNLLLLALMQLIFRFGFLKYQNIYLYLSDTQYLLLVLATVLIAAAGYIINDILDQDTDHINKPNQVYIGKGISEAMGYNLYFLLNVAGVGIGFYLSNVIQKPTFGGIFIIIVTILYMYATTLKQMLLIGNLAVAFVLSCSILIIGVYDLLPLIFDSNRGQMGVIFSLLLDYAIFAFVLNFIREVIKDMQDIEGDKSEGMNTLAIVLGISKTSKLVFGLGIVATLTLVWYINTYLMANQLYYATLYGLIFVVGPMIFFLVKLGSATTSKDFGFLSTVLKWVIFFGILSSAVITFNLMHHVK